MAKYLKKDKKRTGMRIFVMTAILIAVLALITALVIFLNPDMLHSAADDTAPQQTQQMQENTGTAENAVTESAGPQLSALEFPLLLEDGKLEIENLFQYDGINPDCALEEGRNIASVTLKNVSGNYLEEANISMVLTNGTVVNFAVNDLPAGKSAMAFCVDNTAIDADVSCADAVCTASWSSETGLPPEDVSVRVDGMTVTVTNHTGRDISELVVYCRCPLGEEYFGGIAYQYIVNDLPANGSADVEAWDCVLGEAEVVRLVSK